MCVREPRGLRGAEGSARPRCRRRARGARAPAHRHQPITQPGKKKKRKEKLARRRPGRSSQNSKSEPARGVGGRASSSSLGIPQSPGRRNRGINWDPSSSSSPAKPASLWLAAAAGGGSRRPTSRPPSCRSRGASLALLWCCVMTGGVRGGSGPTEQWRYTYKVWVSARAVGPVMRPSARGWDGLAVQVQVRCMHPAWATGSAPREMNSSTARARMV